MLLLEQHTLFSVFDTYYFVSILFLFFLVLFVLRTYYTYSKAGEDEVPFFLLPQLVFVPTANENFDNLFKH